MSITEFILARVAEVEQGAENWRTLDRRHFDQVLAQCDAIRRVVEMHSGDNDAACQSGNYITRPCDTIRAIALALGDDHDFEEER